MFPHRNGRQTAAEQELKQGYQLDDYYYHPQYNKVLR